MARTGEFVNPAAEEERRLRTDSRQERAMREHEGSVGAREIVLVEFKRSALSGA